MNDATSSDLTASLRDQAFEEIERISILAASYSRSIGEAAYRGDQRTLEVHLRQLRDCTIAMCKTYREFL